MSNTRVGRGGQTEFALMGRKRDPATGRPVGVARDNNPNKVGRATSKSLVARRAVWDGHGKNPQANPSNSSGQGHDMHRPGSQNK